MKKVLMAAVLLTGGVSLNADEVTLKNGDRITGTVVGLAGGKLHLKTDHAGSVKIDWKEVASLKTEAAVAVKLADGSVRKGTLERQDGGVLRIRVEGQDDPVEVQPGDVTHFNESPVLWHGNFSAAGRKTDGNTHTSSFLATGEVTRDGKVHDILVKGTFQYADEGGSITERAGYAQGKYDYHFWDGFYVFLSLEGLTDRFKNLRVRSITSAGAGYEIIKEDWITLSAEAGLAYIYNNFRDELVEEDDGYLGGRASAKLFLQLPLDFELRDTFTYYPNFDDTADWQIRNEASIQKGVGTFLGGNWTLTGGVITEIDNEPPAGNEEHDNTYYVGLGFKF